MGIQLARLALHHAARTGLDHAATRLLLHMAIEAYDDENPSGIPPRRYFRSRADMAAAMGVADVPAQRPGASSSAEERNRWTTGNSRVKRALEALEASAAVRRVSAGRPGFNAEFEVTVTVVDATLLGPLISPQVEPDSGPMEAAHRSPRGTAHRSARGPLTGPSRDRSPVPLTGTAVNTGTAAQHHRPARPQESDAMAVDNRGLRDAS